MRYRCAKCKSLNNVKTSFWISKVDAIGFIILSLLLTAPIWFLTFLIEESQMFSYVIVIVALAFAASNKEYKVVALLAIELFIDSLLYESGFYSFSFMVATAYIITFVKIGRKVYGFFFMCVDYKLNIDLFCKKCGLVSKSIKLPSQ